MSNLDKDDPFWKLIQVDDLDIEKRIKEGTIKQKKTSSAEIMDERNVKQRSLGRERERYSKSSSSTSKSTNNKNGGKGDSSKRDNPSDRRKALAEARAEYIKRARQELDVVEKDRFGKESIHQARDRPNDNSSKSSGKGSKKQDMKVDVSYLAQKGRQEIERLKEEERKKNALKNKHNGRFSRHIHVILPEEGKENGDMVQTIERVKEEKTRDSQREVRNRQTSKNGKSENVEAEANSENMPPVTADKISNEKCQQSDDVNVKDKFAKLRFIWVKTIQTKSDKVHLKVPFQADPICLDWNKDKDAFISQEFEVECKPYKCALIVDKREVKVEPLDIKFYTFEADLYLEDEPVVTPAYGERVPLKHPKSKTSTPKKEIEKVVTDSRSRSNLDKNENRVNHKAIDVKGIEPIPRQEKMEMDDNESVTSEGSSIRRSHRLENLVKRQQRAFAGEGRLERSFGNDSGPRRSNLISQSMDHINESYRDNKKEMALGNLNGHEINGSKTISERELNQYYDRKSNSSYGRGSDRISDRYSESSRRSVDTFLPDRERSKDDRYLDTRNVDRFSDNRSRSVDIPEAGRNNLDRDHYSERDRSPTRYNSSERDKSPVRYHDRDRSPSRYSVSDRDRSPTRHPSNTEREDRSPTRHTSNTERDQSPARRSAYDRYSSMPALNTDSRNARDDRNSERERDREREREREAERERRGYLDVTYREPSIRTPLVTSRTQPLSSSSAGPRRATPVMGDNRSKEESERMADLESTVLSLKRQLTERDRDADGMRSNIRNMEDELQRAKSSNTPVTTGNTEADRRINELIREKENISTELWKMKQEFDKHKQQSSEAKDTPKDQTQSKSNSEDGLDYDPNNKRALSRKLEDLESHLRDLQEANESTSEKLSKSEKDIELLRKENEALKMSRGITLRDLEDENASLRTQMERITGLDADSGYLKTEIEQLRQDLRTLRDKNHTIVQDNIKLTEHLKDLELNLEREKTSRSRPSYNARFDNNTSDLAARCERYRKEREAALEEVEYLRSRVKTSRDLTPPRSRDSYYKQNDDVRRTREDKFDRDNFQVRGRSMDSARTREPDHRPMVNGFGNHHDDDYDKRHRRTNSNGSDSTAVLTSAPSGGYARENGEQYNGEPSRVMDRSLDRSLELDDGLDQNKYHSRPKEQVGDVLDELPLRSVRGRYQSKVVEDVLPPEVNTGRKDFSDVNNSTSHSNRGQFNRNDNRDIIDIYGSRMQRESPERGRLTEPHMNFNDIDKPENYSYTSMRSRGSQDVSLVMDDLSEDEEPPKEYRSSQSKSKSNSNVVNGSYNRRDSGESDCTDFILGEAELALNSWNQPGTPRDYNFNSKDVPLKPNTETVAGNQRAYSMTPPGSPRARSPNPNMSSSLRSISPKPASTQHNKHILGVPESDPAFMLTGRRPFCPRSPGDVRIGDLVKFSRQGGKISKGIVKYVGHLPGKNDTYLGVELEKEIAKHDGVYEDQRYFQCKPNKGVFVAFSKVVMAWGQ